MRLASSIQQYVFPLLISFAYSRAPSCVTTRRWTLQRDIAAARTRPFALSTQTSSFEVLRPPRSLSPTGLTRSEPGYLVAPGPLRSSQPNPQIQPRPQPHAPLEDVAAESIGGVLVQTVTQLADQVAAQSAAQITAFASLLRRFDDLRAAVLPMPSRPPLPPNALSAPAPVYQTLSHADAYAPLIAALPQRQQSFASQPAPVPSTIVAPAAPQSVQPLSQLVSAAVAPVPSTVPVFPRPWPMAQLPPQALTAVQLAALPSAALSLLPTPHPHNPLHSPLTGKRKMLTRCSSIPAECDSSSRRAIKSEDLSPTWNSS